jgi:hypothetical protein
VGGFNRSNRAQINFLIVSSRLPTLPKVPSCQKFAGILKVPGNKQSFPEFVHEKVCLRSGREETGQG